jgi:membrane protease YdiL (CAAX protease family)
VKETMETGASLEDDFLRDFNQALPEEACKEGSSEVLAKLLYVQLVCQVHWLAGSHSHLLGFSWETLHWMVGGLEVFPLVFWFLIPLAWTWSRLEGGWFSFARLEWRDLRVYLVVAGVGLLALVAIPFFPGLRSTYPSLSVIPLGERLRFAGKFLLWVPSWLIGWEFLYRYFLLRPVSERWPENGWLLIPILEGINHLGKPSLEALSMVLFSMVLTPWALGRRSVLATFLAHALIEVELLVFLLLF